MKKLLSFILTFLLAVTPMLSLADEALVPTYTITYEDGAGGEVFTKKTYKAEEGEGSPGFTPPERECHVFTGWQPQETETVTGSVAYIAQWKAIDDQENQKLNEESASTEGIGTKDGTDDDLTINTSDTDGGADNDEPHENTADQDPSEEGAAKEDAEEGIEDGTGINTALEGGDTAIENTQNNADINENVDKEEEENNDLPLEETTGEITQTLTVTVNYVDVQTEEPVAETEEKTLTSDTGTFEVTAFEIEGYVLADPEKSTLPVELNEDGAAKPITFLYEQALSMDTMDFLPQSEENLTGELNIRGIGMTFLNHATGLGTFEALVGLNTTSNQANYKPISGVTIKVYDDIGSIILADYGDKTPIATFTTGDPYVFNSGASLDVDKYRNTGKMDIEGYNNKERHLFFIASKEGFISAGSQGFISPGYWVAFQSEGKIYKVTYVSPNTLVPAPTEPIREGYTFGGWYKEQTYENKWDFENDKVITYTYLYAKWTPNFTVTYTDGVEGQEIFGDQKYENLPEGSATPPFVGTPARPGYIFAGWSPQVTNTVTQDITYTAQWKDFKGNNAFNVTTFDLSKEYQEGRFEFVQAPISFTLTHKESGTVIGPQTTSFGAASFFNLPDGTYTLTMVAPPQGYTFAYAKDAVAWDTQIPNSSVTVELAIDGRYHGDFGFFFSPITFTVTYETNGGTDVESETVNANQAFTKPADPTKEGHLFKGWFTDEGLTTPYDFATIATQDITLYAQWEKVIPTFTVTYTDGVEGQEVFGDQKYENLPEGSATPAFSGTPVREGYTFKGWQPQVTPIVTANATYVAQWEQLIVTNHTVYFESNGGTYVAPYYNIPQGSAIAPPTDPVRKGYVFTGWYTEPALKNPWNFKDYGVYNTMTLYAGWKALSGSGTGVPKAGDDGVGPYVALALTAMLIGLGSYGLIKKTKKKANYK